MRKLAILAALGLFVAAGAVRAEECAMTSWGGVLAPGAQTATMIDLVMTEAGPVAVFSFTPFAGPNGKFFAFMLRGETCFTRVVSLGSYDFTTEAARGLGDIGPEERMHHIDLYEPGGHSTLYLNKAPPDFETAKRIALEALR